ncbi:fasciclin-1-like [Saccostrea cucullata]|uniref:fasciclin-1-like n=1 Tax=Saccostrea cuccullata TaxID=36930 RepID=UPI002ED4317B
MEPRVAIVVLLISLCLVVNYVQGQGNILQILRNTTGFSKFAQLVTRAQLTRFYESPIIMTVFAFTDAAYNQIPYRERNIIDRYNETQLRDYLRFCTVAGSRIPTLDFQDIQYVQSGNFKHDRLFFSRVKRMNTTSSFKYCVNGVEISEGATSDISATNGIVHGLNGVMCKTSQKTAYGWIEDPEDTTQRFTKFLDLMNNIYVMDLIDELSSSYLKNTLIVPNDEAMQKIPIAKLNRLKNDPTEIEKIIKAHYIPNRVIFTNCISNNEGITNAQGQSLTFLMSSDNNVYVKRDGVSAAIVEGNITVSNGVVHVVDQLLGSA